METRGASRRMAPANGRSACEGWRSGKVGREGIGLRHAVGNGIHRGTPLGLEDRQQCQQPEMRVKRPGDAGWAPGLVMGQRPMMGRGHDVLAGRCAKLAGGRRDRLRVTELRDGGRLSHVENVEQVSG